VPVSKPASQLIHVNRNDSNGRPDGVVWAGIVIAAFVGLAAGAALQEPRFEVVSVKRNTGGGVGSMRGVQPGGRFMVNNLPVRQVILRAFGIQPFQLTGDAEWLRSEGYDIQAKAPDGAVVTDETMSVMLQAMLADRFKLKVRRETRESPVYDLVFARSDRRLGGNLRQTSAECAANRGGPPPQQLIGPRDPVPCGLIMSGGNRIGAGGRTMAQLATMLGPWVQRMVVDKTGLTGLYDFDLQFLPDPLGRGVAADGPIRMYLVAPDVPPLMTAIQDQLGLKLEAARGAVEYLVIDSIERPS
jgi:uncharacterized protein (TIGR03435 family)